MNVYISETYSVQSFNLEKLLESVNITLTE